MLVDDTTQKKHVLSDDSEKEEETTTKKKKQKVEEEEEEETPSSPVPPPGPPIPEHILEDPDDDLTRNFKGWFRWFPSKTTRSSDQSAQELYDYYKENPKLIGGDVREIKFQYRQPTPVQHAETVVNPPEEKGVLVNPSVINVMKTKRVASHTPEWFKERYKCITASELASIIGWNSYTTVTEVFKKKLNFITKDSDSFKSKPCQHGHNYEPEAACVYEYLTENELIQEEIGFIRHKKFPFIGGTPDRLLRNLPIPVEIKCPFRRRISMTPTTKTTEHTQGVPPLYYCQVQLQMFILGPDEFKMAHYVEYKPPVQSHPHTGQKGQLGLLSVREVDFDEKWIRKQIPLLYAFWLALQHYPSPDKIMTKEQQKAKKSSTGNGFYVPNDADNMMLYNYPKAFLNLAKNPNIQRQFEELVESDLNTFIQNVMGILDKHTERILEFLRDSSISLYKKREILDKQGVNNEFSHLDEILG
jgi:putative phage-type endonuclease